MQSANLVNKLEPIFFFNSPSSSSIFDDIRKWGTHIVKEWVQTISKQTDLCGLWADLFLSSLPIQFFSSRSQIAYNWATKLWRIVLVHQPPHTHLNPIKTNIFTGFILFRESFLEQVEKNFLSTFHLTMQSSCLHPPILHFICLIIQHIPLRYP